MINNCQGLLILTGFEEGIFLPPHKEGNLTLMVSELLH
ncbi:hypothetical protein [Salmonella phage SD-1_S14]|nr:hypothetical protein [Salmonella phage SD-2_S15]WPK19261.1 hypothetical protein [Salmonella phage SD-6_S16]WPK19936.1 hypothetical protein [Salmonella phage SD-1_S14]WPK20954.1 hypothetical protein [Salmonella phage SD-15_S21]